MTDPNAPWFSEGEVEYLRELIREFGWDDEKVSHGDLISKIETLGKRRRYAPGDLEYISPLQQELLEERKDQQKKAEKAREENARLLVRVAESQAGGGLKAKAPGR